jgi:hypothetical protein
MAVAVQSPFNTSPAYSQTFIPTIWSGKLNVKFYATTVFGEIANTSYEGDIKALGDAVNINNIPSITISTYTVGMTLSYQVPVPSLVTLTINKAKYFGVNVSDVLAYQSQPKLMDMFTSDAAKQMAISIDTDVLLGCYNGGAAANKGATAGAVSGAFNLGTDLTPVTLSTTNIISTFTAMSSVLDEQNTPETDRWLIISPVERQLLMNSPLAQAYVTGDPASILRNGKIGTIDRFTLYVSNLLPKAAAGQDFSGNTLTSALKRHAVLAGHKTAITFASQIAKVESIQNPNDFGSLVRGLNIYGYLVVKPEALALLLAAG